VSSFLTAHQHNIGYAVPYYESDNRRRACDFLLVPHSNFGPILHRFIDIAGFCAYCPTPIPPYFGCVIGGPDRPSYGQPEQCTLTREIIFEVFEPVCKKHT